MVRPARSLFIALIAIAVVTTACGDDTTSSPATTVEDGSATTGDDVAAADVLGEPNPANGTPVRIGFVTDGITETYDGGSEVRAAEAAASYINEYLGGIGGHRVELDVCETLATPAGATDCANQMIADGVPVVLNAVTSQGATLVRAVTAAGIPTFFASAVDQDVLLADDSYVMTNGVVVGLSGPAQVLKDAGGARGAVIVIDVPAATTGVNAIGPAFYANANAELEVVAVPPGTPDMTPQVQAALSSDPDQFAILGTNEFCNSAINAIRTLAFTGTIVIIPQCLPLSSTNSADVQNITMLSSVGTDPDDPEVQLYHAILDEYAPDVVPQERGADLAFQVMLGFARAMSDVTGALTAESVRAGLAAMTDQPMPLASGLTFRCDRTAMVVAPAICSTGALIAQLDSSGHPTAYEAFDGAAISQLG